ncbi:DUF134 domain-containing protein [Syntrophorhabdus aromaticivorans]|uniref:DUF134 domain-containing protein n=1 Tax=Syntrophorhabdus aromaticivorans TaxID=328301 RepID=UPI000562264C|nr:DUF134 domain-containing protein [Syntrophorhabdus aromaticivorans]HBA54985.1 DUF134 domain-containing protein [Syntrophorhabdus aromaticivorans]
MSRPKKCRCIGCKPSALFFKPTGIPMVHLEQVYLDLDEFEALRLADLEGLYHKEAAARMNVSRPTFSRIISRARQKVADAIINGKALVIETENMEEDQL